MKESVRIDIEGELLWKFRVIREALGIEASTDVIRNLITERFKDLEKEEKAPSRFSHFNVYQDHVTIRDNLDGDLYDVYIKDRRLYCDRDKSSGCEHVDYAYNIKEVQDVLR